MKRMGAGLLTLAAVLAIVWWKSAPSGNTAGNATPQKCVQQMFEAATQGDVKAYLDCFSEPVRKQMQQELSGAAVSNNESLRKSTADLKGWAIIDPPAEVTGTTCQLTVEWVYTTRVDRQQLGLDRTAQGWQITRVDRVQPSQPAIPYGTPVSGIK